MAIDLGADIAAVQRIAAVPRILDMACRSTGMGLAALAMVFRGTRVADQSYG